MLNLDSPRLQSLLKDSGWRAALHILTCPTFRRDEGRLWPHVDIERGNLWFAKIVDEDRTWSSSEDLMLRAAWSLFNGDEKVSLYRLGDRLDDAQFQTLLNALAIFRSSLWTPKAGLLHENARTR